MANTYGLEPLGTFSDGQVLPTTGSADSTNMVKVGKPTNGALWVSVFAQAAIKIPTGEAFSIELESYSADTSASAIAPFSINNKGGNIKYGGGTAETHAHFYPIHKTSADDELDFAAGDLICDFGVPERMLNAIGHNYIQLVYSLDGTPESTEKLDAFVHLKV